MTKISAVISSLTHITKLFQSFGKLNATTVQINKQIYAREIALKTKWLKYNDYNYESIRFAVRQGSSIEELQHLEWQHKHSVSKIFTDPPNKRNTRCTRCNRFVSYSSHILQVPWYNSFQDPCLMKFKWPLFDKGTSTSQTLSQWVFPVKLLPSDL